MLKKTVTYTDFNKVTQTEELYFNLTRMELTEMLDLQPRLEAWQAKITPETQQLTVPQIKELLAIVKELVQASYGRRTDDGKHFRKSEEMFADFKDSAAYDTFMFGLFTDPDAALGFLSGIMPEGMEDLAERVAQLPSTEMTQVDAEVPAYIREDREPTQAELTAMTPTELQAAFSRKTKKQAQQ